MHKMITKRWKWMSSVVLGVYLLQPCLATVCAAEEAMGEAVSIGSDAGEDIVEPSEPEKESNLPWILGIAGAAVAGYGIYELVDGLDDDSEEAKEDAEAAQDDAEDAAAAASAATESAAAAEESATAAAEASEEDEGFEYTVYLTGKFQGSTTTRDGEDFKPMIEFAVASGAYDGGIVGYREEGTNGISNLGGSYKQVGDKAILITVDHSFYLGECEIYDSNTIRLNNGTVMYAQENATAYLQRND